jgi:integrase
VPRQKKPFLADLAIAASATGSTLRAQRDRALILCGFGGAFRASELCALDVEDIEFCEQGMRIHIIREGAIFRVIAGRRSQRITSARLHRRNVALLVKSRVAVLGLDEGAYSAHSLRSGWIATAAARAASIFKLKEVSRHKSTDVLAGYVWSQSLFSGHAGEGLL